jgi:hypothetical protein
VSFVSFVSFVIFVIFVIFVFNSDLQRPPIFTGYRQILRKKRGSSGISVKETW